MKLLFLSLTYPTPKKPGQGAFNYNMVRALRELHDVRVIAPIPWVHAVPWVQATPWRQRVRHSDTADEVRSSVDYFPTFCYPPKVMRRWYDSFLWYSILPSIRRLEQTFVPDLVLGYWLHPDGAVAARIADRYDADCIVLSGGSDLRLLAKDPGRRAKIQRVMKQVNRLVCVSRDLADHAQSLGMPVDSTDVIYRGVNRECFRPIDRNEARRALGVAPESVMIFWAGRFESVKNPSMLLRAAQRWQGEWGQRVKVVVAGDGSLASQLRRLRDELGLRDCVRFEGNLTQSELAIRYNAANVTVLTSQSEGVPNVLLESIACGTPFVSTNVGGVAEIATPGIDRLVEPEDVEAFANAVIDVVVTDGNQTGPPTRVFVPDGLADMASRFQNVISSIR